jgi:hypothetical protein
MVTKTRTGNITEEPCWYGEVATYRHENAGRVSFETVSSANKNVKPTIDSERTTRLGKVRVETRVTEWKGTDTDGKVYQKDIETVQINENSGGSNTPISHTGGNGTPNSEEPTHDLTPMQVLKNMMDEGFRSLRNDATAQWIVIVCIALIAAAAIFLPR